MEPTFPLVPTKIIVPRRRAELLSRQRLLDLLFEFLDDKLIIVTAPAGSGKTSLLIDFVHQVDWPVCWLALDPLDLDPQRFIFHFISSIRQRFPQFGQSSLAVLEGMGQTRLDLDSLVSLIVNDAYNTISEHFLIVLDDFHLVEGRKEINVFINRFIQDVDENCHLVIASRTLLSLPDMPLLVARSQVGGASFEDLAFQPDEIQKLLSQNYQQEISEAEAQDLARETDGWITGLLLSTQTIGGGIASRLRIARVSGVGLYEYLVKQVLDLQPAEIQQFLLRTSLLEEFDAALCEEVIGPALSIQLDWRELMEKALHNNLFILQVGDDRLYLRYHHLFRDFLQARIQKDFPEETGRILLRLAEYNVAQEEWERAYELYKRVGSVDAQLALIQRAGPVLMTRGRFLTLSEWLENIRSDDLLSHPALISLKGAVLTVRGDPVGGLNLLNRAVDLFREKKDDSLALSLERRSTTYRLSGKLINALMDAEEALSLTKNQSTLTQVRADALLSKGLTLFDLGKRNEAIPLLNEALEAYQFLGDEETAAKVRMETGRMLKASGKYEAAAEAYQKALEHFQITHNLAWQANLYNNLGVLQGLKGDYIAAAGSLEKAIQYARLGAYPRLEAYAIASMGDLYRDLDSLGEAQEAYRQARPIAQRINERLLLFYLNLAEARTALLQNRKTVAQELLRAAETMAEEDESEYERYACALEQGALHCSTRAFHQAVDYLALAVEFFDREEQQVETVRAHLLLGAALDRMEEHEQADEHFHLLESLLNDAEKIHLLITPAREIRGLLEQSPNPWTAELLEKVVDFESQSSMVRRMLRRQTLAVPLGPPSLVIRTLGKTQVKVGDHIVTSAEWQSQTARDFFFLILNHPEGLSKEEVGVTFWPDSTPAELKQRFKNTIYRLRHAVGKDVVLFDEDYYRFNRAVDYELDCEAFEKELGLAQTVADEEEKLAHFHSAAKIYRGSFLPDMDAYWVITERDRLQNRYVDAMIKMGQLHLERGEMLETLSACRKMLEDDQCQEAAHRLAMQAYAAMGNRAGVVRQYEQCRDALDKEYGAAPSGQTQKLYEALMK